jgi:uncharacterized RDD family membrane protein YckC
VTDAVTFGWLTVFVLIEIDQRLLGGDPWGLERGRPVVDSTRSLVLLLVLVGIYEVVPVTLKGVTLGKAVTGLRVRRQGGGRVPVALAAVRAVLLYAPLFLGAYALLGFIVLLLSFVIPRSGRGFHDRIAGTIVVTLPRDES